MSKIDVEQVLATMRQHLTEHGMVARGADGTDFQFEADRTLYFRTGSSYGEVSILSYRDERAAKRPIRITSEKHVAEAKHQIDRIIRQWRQSNARPDVDLSGWND